MYVHVVTQVTGQTSAQKRMLSYTLLRQKTVNIHTLVAVSLLYIYIDLTSEARGPAAVGYEFEKEKEKKETFALTRRPIWIDTLLSFELLRIKTRKQISPSALESIAALPIDYSKRQLREVRTS